MSERRISALPPSLPPRGLSRPCAAEYVGVGVTKFDELVSDGRMPAPRVIDTRKVWDRLEVDQYFAALPADMDSNPWDGMAA